MDFQCRIAIEKCSQVFLFHSPSDFCVFSFLLSREGELCFCAFCTVVANYGHVSLIVDQLDWQFCRSPLVLCCEVVAESLVSHCEP